MKTKNIAYVSLWFPLSSETFIFREVKQLRQKGLPIFVYTLYGLRSKGLSDEMTSYNGPLTRIGLRHTFNVFKAFVKHLYKKPAFTWQCIRECLLRKMRDLEAMAENSVCFFEAFYLAELLKKDNIQLIHAPWANGSATAAWVASRISGIPFAMTGRARDIHPQDGLLREKLRDCVFMRTNNKANVEYLASFCEQEQRQKIHLVYNSLTLKENMESSVYMKPPYKLLAVGRFCGKKGFDILLRALHKLKQEGFLFHLTLVGDGFLFYKLKYLCKKLQLQDVVSMPGFVPNNKLIKYIGEHDVMITPSVIHKSGDRDGIPNVIMEALSSRLPVIATDISGIGEVVINNETGLLIAQRDVDALVQAIKTMCADRENALHLAEKGRELVKKMFDSEVNTQALYDLYIKDYPST